MAARWSLEDFLKQKLFFFLLALVIGSIDVTGGAADPPVLLGKIGGNVTFRCPVEPKKLLKILYLQRGLSFVNGFFVSRNISNKWQNTRMDEKSMTVHMHSVNVSHEGIYECIVEHYNNPKPKTSFIHLRVTGDFSKPEFTVLHHDKISWTVMCSSYGGYPSSEMIWNTNGSRMVEVLNPTVIPDPVSLTFNSSSTAVFNCSKGEILFISCSVRDVTSAQFPVCTPEPDVPSNPSQLVMVAIVLVIIITFIIVIAVSVKIRKKCRRTEGAEVETHAAVSPEWVKGNISETLLTEEEETALTRGKDAP